MATPLKPWEKNNGGISLSVGATNSATEYSRSPQRPAVPPRPSSIGAG